MSNNGDAKQDFTNALNAGQEVPVTVNPFQNREQINSTMFTSGNTGTGLPQLPGPTQATPQVAAFPSKRMVQDWIVENVLEAHTQGDPVILRSKQVLYDEVGDPTYQMYQQLRAHFGKAVVFINTPPWMLDVGTTEVVETSVGDPNGEDEIEKNAQMIVQSRITGCRTQKRVDELEKEAIKAGDLPKPPKTEEK